MLHLLACSTLLASSLLPLAAGPKRPSESALAAPECYRDTDCTGRDLCMNGTCAPGGEWEEACTGEGLCGNSKTWVCRSEVCKSNAVIRRRGGDVCVSGGHEFSVSCFFWNTFLYYDSEFSDDASAFAKCEEWIVDICGALDGRCTAQSEDYCKRHQAAKAERDELCDRPQHPELDEGLFLRCCSDYVNRLDLRPTYDCQLAITASSCEEAKQAERACIPLDCSDPNEGQDPLDTETEDDEIIDPACETSGENTKGETDGTTATNNTSSNDGADTQGGACSLSRHTPAWPLALLIFGVIWPRRTRSRRSQAPAN